ncbi:MAG: hypothetical protein RMI43_02080 [Candidatus Caldarchaeum sp.]|nr:hypothetical protein [Candidatus Caldarchaeum sp.]MDW8062941.1 hypothetical protein [Candidatus Caldarchaeum sp.]
MASRHATVRRMRLLGEVLRVGKSKILVKAFEVPRLAVKVYDRRGREIGYVSNVLGPVSSPHVSVKVVEGREVKEGEALYIEKV